MKRIRFSVPRLGSYSADTGFELCGDLGGGTIDYSKPLPPGRARLWLEARDRAGHLLDGHLIGRHFDAVDADGHLEGMHLWDAHLEPVLPVVVESPRYVFGRFRHAIRMFDGTGNASSGAPTEHVCTINDSPPIPRGFKRSGWDSAGKRFRFALEPVRFGAVAGS